MYKLSEILGQELWQTLQEALAGKGKDGKDLELAVTNDGSFIPKGKFDALNKEYQSLRENFNTVQNELQTLSPLAQEKEELLSALANAKEQLAQAAAEKEKAILTLEREHFLETALREAGARNNKAVRALLNEDALVWDEEKLNGLKEQLALIKNDAPYLFDDDNISSYQPKLGGSRPDYSKMSDKEYYRYLKRKG